MALTDKQKLAAHTAILQGAEFTLGDAKIFQLNGGRGFCVQKLDSDGTLSTDGNQVVAKSWDKALLLFELFSDPTALHAYTTRIVLSKVTVITSSAERAKELAMKIYESDAITQLDQGLCVEYVEVEDVGPSLCDETEVDTDGGHEEICPVCGGVMKHRSKRLIDADVLLEKTLCLRDHFAVKSIVTRMLPTDREETHIDADALLEEAICLGDYPAIKSIVTEMLPIHCTTQCKGRQVMKKAWRVCDDPRSNDSNDGPEHIVVPYTIIGESKDGKAYLVKRNDRHREKPLYYIPKQEFFFSKEEAEAAAYKKTPPADMP